ncbi:exodeoxyribonuclease VII small subunit [Mucilaginibacter flavidus]|uniref:exodeoxyribonuclease VII small subunit n=1 Tax=Mucilaginibacter flavidus TaxID=2949309 RepID=UPI002093510C|nr:exodeoxyribonuclease VII small subunit [Mucilaginibacter flavidus]MCO5948076.1 exodeoxyribonuclease VII small subunit [Mucilaginibacter flavidus]
MEINMSYEDAFKELRQIEADIQNETVSVDVLAEKIKRASELIALCQSKLTKTEAEVNKIISQMEQKPANG